MTETKPQRSTYGIEISSTYVGQRKDERDHDWEHHAWEVTLTRPGKVVDNVLRPATAITFSYRMGLGHEQTRCGKRKPSTTSRYAVRPMQVCHHVRCENAGWVPAPPTLYDALTALKADATHGESFRDWCGNYGMDDDSIKARDLYLACQQSEDRSRRFFGADWATIVEDEEYE